MSDKNKGPSYEQELVLAGLLILGFAVAWYMFADIGGYIVALAMLYIGWKLYRRFADSAPVQESSERALLEELYEKAKREYSPENIEHHVDLHVPGNTHDSIKAQLYPIAKRIISYEGGFGEIPRPPVTANSIEGARYKDQLAKLSENKKLVETVAMCLGDLTRAMPRMEGTLQVQSTFSLTTDAVLDEIQYLPEHRNYYNNQPQKRTPEEILGELPLGDVFQIDCPFSIPDTVRNEHMWIVGGSGHGKTQTIQYFIAQDLEEIAEGNRSAVVIDSQGDLINTILKTELESERTVLIDAEDVEYPVCLNLFGIGQDRLATYSQLERERLTNSILELYDFVLSSLLDAGMTQKQNVIFRYVTRLMLYIPNATIHTLREVLEPGGAGKYREHVNKLTGTARHFFDNEFDGREFTQTRQQVLRRLYGVLENQAFERMFTNPVSKFDMFTEMNAGKLILINTSQSLLKTEGSKLFGRFFIALLMQAAQERATITNRTRVHVYIDEAHEYFDNNISLMLAQARKYNIGLTLAQQYVGQASPQLIQALEANTSIKMAGGVSARDAATLARQLNTTPDTIQNASKGTFVTSIKGTTPRGTPLTIPFGVLEDRDKGDADWIRYTSRAAYAEKIEEAAPPPPEPEEPEVEERGEW